MVTDLVQIRRLGEAKQAENVAFRRHLAAHHHRVEEFQSIAVSIEKQIDCTTCANCCRYSIVAVSHPEIEAIASHLGLEPDQVTRRHTMPDPDASSARVLRSTRDGCIFLDGNLCTIYQARPKACREFPHVTPGSHSLGSRISSQCRWAPYCPILYNALETYKHVMGFHVGV